MASRIVAPLPLCLVVVLGIVVRLLHLIPGDHYYLLGTDSYYFHEQAERLADGQPIAAQHSGLVYPLAYLGESAGYWLPVLFGVISILLFYWLGNRYIGHGAGLIAAVVAALLPHNVLITASGNIDRDGINVLLVVAAVIYWYELKDRYPITAALAATAFIEILVFEWVWVGRVIIIAVITAISIALLLFKQVKYSISAKVSLFLLILWNAGLWMAHNTLRQTNGIVNTAVEYSNPGHEIAEVHGLDLATVISSYGFWMLFLVFGVIVAFMNRRDNKTLVWLVWFALLAVTGVFVQRVLVYAIPSVIMLTTLGVYKAIWFIRHPSIIKEDKKRLAAILAVVIFVVSITSVYQAYKIADNRGMAPNQDWVSALHYIRDNTPADAVIVTQPNYWKWVYDLAERQYTIDGPGDYVISIDSSPGSVYANDTVSIYECEY